MSVCIRLLGEGEAGALARVAEDVFDNAVRPELAAEFLADPRHHMAVAIDDGTVVGMASAVHYLHPDKPPELWINEVCVAGPWRREGLGRRLMEALLDHGRALGCGEAWLGTEPDNAAARGLYAALDGRAEPFLVYSFDLVEEGGTARDELQ